MSRLVFDFGREGHDLFRDGQTDRDTIGELRFVCICDVGAMMRVYLCVNGYVVCACPCCMCANTHLSV